MNQQNPFIIRSRYSYLNGIDVGYRKTYRLFTAMSATYYGTIIGLAISMITLLPLMTKLDFHTFVVTECILLFGIIVALLVSRVKKYRPYLRPVIVFFNNAVIILDCDSYVIRDKKELESTGGVFGTDFIPTLKINSVEVVSVITTRGQLQRTISEFNEHFIGEPEGYEPIIDIYDKIE